MGLLRDITIANRETRQVEADERARETSIRNLQRMRQVDADAATERDRQARAKASAAADIPGLVDLGEGTGWKMAPGLPTAPATAPAAAPTSFTQDQIRFGQKSQHRMRNTTPDSTPNQSAAETARLARYPGQQRRQGMLDANGYDNARAMAAADVPSQVSSERVAQLRRRSELARLNPTTGGTTNQSAAESSRLLDRSGTPGLPTGAPAGADDAKAAFVQQYLPIAQRAGEKLGVDPRVLLAQWAQETGWGKSVIPGTNNLGNIKDVSGAGVPARDNMLGTTDRYRQFDTPDAFADHYAGLISRRYPGAVGSGADMGKFAGAMVAGGYAEDPQYAAKLQQVYNSLPGGVTPPARPSTQVAAAPQAQPAAAPQQVAMQPFSPDAVGGRRAGAESQDLRILNMQMAEVKRRLQFPQTAEIADQLRGAYIELASKAQQVQVREAAARAVEDDRSLTALAQAASVPFAQTPQGFVLVRPAGDGQWVAASAPVDRMSLITHIAGILTGSSSAAAAERRKAELKTQGDIAVERVKGENTARTAALNHQYALQQLIQRNELNADEIMGVENGQAGQQLVRTRRGVFEVVPGVDLGGGMMSAPSLRALPMR